MLLSIIHYNVIHLIQLLLSEKCKDNCHSQCSYYNRYLHIPYICDECKLNVISSIF